MRFIRIALALLLLAGLMACNINTMYNARNYFKSAQSKPLNSNGKPNAQAIEEYTKTIKKCGIIISERKKGAQLDEAVFLMAKALYYKGNSAFQAKDQFQNLLIGFPNSPYVPEAHIFIARILREINQPKEAERTLDEFVRNPRFRKDHPKALLLMTDFAIQDKDYTRAQYWLERIIRDYPKTKEFKQAYFLFGKNYYEQKDYTASLAAFEKMQGTRGIDKALKLDTRYYIGLNQLELGMLEQAYRTTNNLLRIETRLDKIPAIKLLKVRILFAQNDNDDAKKEIDDITKQYPRTESAAAAYYYLAEYQYYKAGDPTAAVTNYTRVRSEFSGSPFGTIAQSKATAVTNVMSKTGLNSEIALKALLDYHYQAAESFLSYLALPDSAIASYRKVISERDVLAAKRDSLQMSVTSYTNTIDSLRVASLAAQAVVTEEDSLVVATDSLVITPIVLPAGADSLLYTPPTVPHEEELTVTPAGADTLVLIEPKVAEADSLQYEVAELPIAADSLAVTPDSLLVAQQEQVDAQAKPEVTEQAEVAKPDVNAAILLEIKQTETQVTRVGDQISKLDEIIAQFDTEIIPFCLFAIGSVLHDNYPESPQNSETLTLMQTNYANNKYTKALSAIQQGQTVRLIDPFEESQEAKLDSLFGMVETAPDSALAGLQEMRQSTFARLKLAANFRLGWYYSFDSPDTTAAKEYLKAVLDDTNAGEYAELTRRFYDGSRYVLWDQAVIDTLVVADSLFVPDSLRIAAPTAEQDTLQIINHENTLPQPYPFPEIELAAPPAPVPPPIIKDEDDPLE